MFFLERCDGFPALLPADAGCDRCPEQMSVEREGGHAKHAGIGGRVGGVDQPLIESGIVQARLGPGPVEAAAGGDVEHQGAIGQIAAVRPGGVPRAAAPGQRAAPDRPPPGTGAARAAG